MDTLDGHSNMETKDARERNDASRRSERTSSSMADRDDEFQRGHGRNGFRISERKKKWILTIEIIRYAQVLVRFVGRVGDVE